MTGPKENVDAALKKLGQYVDNREAHQNLFLIGNDKTGLWKKAFGLAKPEEIFPVVDSVVNDKGWSLEFRRIGGGPLAALLAQGGHTGPPLHGLSFFFSRILLRAALRRPPTNRKQIERGRRIYLEGVSPSGAEITAVMSEASVEVPASAVPCAGCHGATAKAGPRGEVAPRTSPGVP